MALRRACVTAAALCLGAALTTAADRKPVRAAFFFTPGCRLCKETKEAVRHAEQTYGRRLEVEWVDLADRATGTQSAERLFRLLDSHGIDETPPLSFFVDGTCLAGGERIIAEIGAAIDRALASPREAVHEPGLGGDGARTDRLGLWAISTAALADGVNPCAFATIVLLVSMMATAHRSRSEMLVIGGVFTAAVYVTYLVVGVALFGLLHRLRGFLLVSDLVFYAAFAACVVLAALSLFDATLAWRGITPEHMLVKLPDSLRARMAKYLRLGVRSRSLAAGALAAGVIVSLLESVCTGQVYFPVIAGLVRDASTRSRGIILLVWYNILFVLPLAIVLAMALLGVGSDRLAAFGRRHWGATKLALAVVFGLMAWWMMPGLVWPPGGR